MGLTTVTMSNLGTVGTLRTKLQQKSTYGTAVCRSVMIGFGHIANYRPSKVHSKSVSMCSEQIFKFRVSNNLELASEKKSATLL